MKCTFSYFYVLEKAFVLILGPLFLSFSFILELLEGVLSTSGSSWTFIFKNGRPAVTGARFSKPVRARTGSELLRERMLSLGMKRAGERVREDETRSQITK